MFLQPLATLIFTVAAGVLSLVLASKLRVPSILFLLAFGVLLGPEFANLIQPGIFRSEFPHYISLMVALILFEGGSSLKFSQFKEISSSLRSLLSVGVLITLAGVSLAVHWIAGMPFKKAILFGSIMVVTGPTVVIPILKRLRIQQKIHNILKWEAILIDPIGVILAVVLFEFLILGHGGIFDSILLFSSRFLLGIAIGWCTGMLLVAGLSKKRLLLTEGEEIGGLFVLGTILFSYGISEFILTESGLVTVTVAGIYFANKKFPFQKEVDHFKDQVVLFCLSILFVLLASNIPVRQALRIPIEGTLLIAVIVFLIRPISVLVSTLGNKTLRWNEKLFLCFMAPRGIVSASLASLFAIEFEARALTGRGVFLPLAFYVIAGSIVVYALISEVVAHLTGVKEGKQTGVIIVGGNSFALLIGQKLRELKIAVKLIDSNGDLCRRAREMGFEAYEGSGFDAEFLESLDIKGVGKMLALTPNHEVNVLCCQVFSKYLGRDSVFRLWDKADLWESVTSPHYDSSWGRPLLAARDHDNVTLLKLAEKNQLDLGIVELSEPLKASAELKENKNQVIPLFAVTDEVLFFSSNVALPSKSQAVFIHSKAEEKI